MPDPNFPGLPNPSPDFAFSLSSDLSLPLPPAQLGQLSPSALAYLGDAVYELYVRHHFLIPPKRGNAYHRQVVAQVCAEAQARHLQTLMPLLSDEEAAVVRRGRNAASGKPKRVDITLYQQATGFEALIGYLYLTNPQRLQALLQTLTFD
jgi:ribonuclease III family protein